MSSMRPLVSIVVAVYNSETSIRRTLESICAQTYPAIELIVIDGRSTDNTWSIVQEFSNSIAYKISEKDRGIADAYNKGIAASSGEWIYFLNSDDVFYEPTILSKLFDSRDIDASVTIRVGIVVGDDGRLFDKRYNWRMLIRNEVHHQGIFYRGRFLREFPYNPDYRSYGHDHEHNLFIWRRKEPIEYLPDIVAIWARGGISDRADWKQYREEFRVRRNVVGKLAFVFNVFSPLRFVWKRLRQL